MKRVALALLLCTSMAAAQAPRAVRIFVSAPTCSPRPASLDTTSELVEIEVRAQNIQTTPSEGGARLAIVVGDCEGRLTTLRLVSADSRRTETRELDTSGIDPATRPRVIALATAELLRRTRVFELAPVASPAPVGPPPASRWVEASGELRVFAAARTVLAGPRVDLTLPMTRLAELGVGAGVGFGRGDDPLGHADFGLATLRLAPRLVARPSERFAVTAGVVAELGAGWTRGASAVATATSDSGTAAVLLLGLSVAARAELARHLWLTFGVDGAGALAGLRARAETRSVGGVYGLELGTRAGLALDF